VAAAHTAAHIQAQPLPRQQHPRPHQPHTVVDAALDGSQDQPGIICTTTLLLLLLPLLLLLLLPPLPLLLLLLLVLLLLVVVFASCCG
jgi:hypothetical protein